MTMIMMTPMTFDGKGPRAYLHPVDTNKQLPRSRGIKFDANVFMMAC